MTDSFVRLYDSVESTNDLALKAARAGNASHGDCWVADHQSQGRGRREVGGERRQWFSPRGVNLHFSILLEPKELDPARAAGVTLAAGVGLCEAINATSQFDGLWLKWPNDVFVNTLKLGGVLTEAVTHGSKVEAIVLGVGLNVNVKRSQIPRDLTNIMTGLAIETQRRQDRFEILQRARQSIIAWCDAYMHKGFSALSPGLERWDDCDGRQVDIFEHDSRREGVARGIDENGHLRVELPDGTMTALHTGEVQLKV